MPERDGAQDGTGNPRVELQELALFRALFDAMPQLAWTARPDGFIEYYNRGWYEYTGTTYEVMQGSGRESVHHPDHRERVKAAWLAGLAAAEPIELEIPLRRFDGAFRWFLTRIRPMRNEEGKLIRWVGINTDIQDQRAAQDALRQSNDERLRVISELESQRARDQALFREAPVAIVVLRGPTHIVELVNPVGCQALGRTSEQMLGIPFVEAVPGIRGQGYDGLLDRIFQSGNSHTATDAPANLDRTGTGKRERFYFDFAFEPLRNAGGQVDGIVAIASDVTARVATRELLEEKTRRLAFSAQIGAVLTSDAPFKAQLRQCCEAMVSLGAAFARVWTLSNDEGVLELQASSGTYTHLDGEHARVPVGHLKIGRIAQERRPHLTNSVQDDPQISNPDWARAEGMVAFAGYPLLVGDRLMGVMALFARQELSAGTLEALGSVSNKIAMAIERERGEQFREIFIGMLGHDLLNPLSAVLVSARTIKLSPNLADRARLGAERVISSAERMARMVEHLLDFARARSGSEMPVTRVEADIFEICRTSIQELGESHPDRTITLQALGDGRGEWDVDRMAQVFSNLIGNALAYGRSDAPIRVTLRTEKQRVIGEVLSFGAVIASADVAEIFDPYRRAADARMRTTKSLGLGLFITKEIIRAHGGTIEVSSSELGGTAFRFSVPRKSAP